MGFVYVFKQKETNFYKIGMTDNTVDSRFSQFKMYSPNGADIVQVIESINARALEKELHEKFKHLRLSGEFFELSQKELDQIAKYQSEKMNDAMTYFFRYVSGNMNNVDSIISAMKTRVDSKKIMAEETEETYKKYIDFLLKNHFDKKLTSGEIYLILLDEFGNDEIQKLSRKTFGTYMRGILTQKTIKENGVVKRVYFIQ